MTALCSFGPRARLLELRPGLRVSGAPKVRYTTFVCVRPLTPDLLHSPAASNKFHLLRFLWFLSRAFLFYGTFGFYPEQIILLLKMEREVFPGGESLCSPYGG